MGTPRPRVLLVEDDTAIRQWVEMVLEDEPLELLQCRDVDSALLALQHAPVQLLLTDLMLPGRSGYELLELLAARPALRAGACLVAFSAGMDLAARNRLASLGVWRCLSKPASVQELLDCVQAGLAQASGAASQPVAAPAQAAGQPDLEGADRQALAMARHFGGNAALFQAFETSCQAALHDDLQRGDAALAAGDTASLRVQAHSLKSVLRMLALDALADHAQVLETSALAGDLPACRTAWEPLAQGLRAWLSGAAPDAASPSPAA